MPVKDWLPAILGGVVGAADPQSGQALAGALSMADAFKRRRLMDERAAKAEAMADEQFNWARANAAEQDRQRRDATHDRMILDQMRGKYNFTDWSADTIAAANAADTPAEFMSVVEAVTGRKYRETAEGRAVRGMELQEAGEVRAQKGELRAERGMELQEGAAGRAEESHGWARDQYGYSVSQRPMEELSRMFPLLSNFFMSASQVPSLSRKVSEAETAAAHPPMVKDPYLGRELPTKATPEEIAKNPALGEAEQMHKEKGAAEVAAAQDELGTTKAQAERALQMAIMAYNTMPPGPAKDALGGQIQQMQSLMYNGKGVPQPGGDNVTLDPETSAAVDALVNKHMGGAATTGR